MACLFVVIFFVERRPWRRVPPAPKNYLHRLLLGESILGHDIVIM